MPSTRHSLLAALMLFTRLPWWRIAKVPTEAFTRAVDFWPFAGWVTGGAMGTVVALTMTLGLSPLMAAAVAVASRLLLTGALHEDGLADCADGFGGGTSRERILLIMKDSHIGSYGVIALIMGLLLLVVGMADMSAAVGRLASASRLTTALREATVVMLIDVTAKAAASWITSQAAYARAAEAAKVGVVYRSRRSLAMHALRCLLAISLPAACAVGLGMAWVIALLPIAFVVETLLVTYIKRRIGGYTGDCCGAVCLLCELSLYVALAAALASVMP